MSRLVTIIKESKVAFFGRFIKAVITYKSISKTKEFQASAEALKAYKDIHKGERCFIIATGPSLTIEDVDKLKNEYTFSMNSCIKLFDYTDWRPTYYCVTDINVWNKIGNEIKTAPLNTVFYEATACDYKGKNGVPFFQSMQDNFLSICGLSEGKFSVDASKVLYGGSTVVYTILQLAMYMGFKQIFFIGQDCNFRGPQKHNPLLEHGISGATKSQEYMLKSFELVKKVAVAQGIEIYNATRGGKLEIFERIDLDEVLQANQC